MAIAKIIPKTSTVPLYFYCMVKEVWSDAWTYAPHLWPLRCTHSVAPTVSSAAFEIRYGNIWPAGETTPDFFFPMILDGWFVGIFTNDWNGNPLPVWVGVVEQDLTNMHGSTTFASGVQTLTAYGLEQILDRIPIRGSYVGTTFIDRTLSFNERTGSGMQPKGNCSENVDADGIYYHDALDGYLWSNQDIAEHLVMNYNKGRYTNGAAPGITFSFSGEVLALNQIIDAHDFSDMSIGAALDKLCNRRRGMGWTVWTNGISARINVFSYLDVPYSVAGYTVPANSDQWIVSWDGDPYAKPAVLFSDTRRFDCIEAWGGPVYSTFTLSFADATLEEGWSAAQETAYKNVAGSSVEKKDAARQALELRDVYTLYVAPEDWDWFAGNGVGGAQNNAAPGVTDLGEVDPTYIRDIYGPEHKFERILPWPIAGGDPAANDYEKPFVLLYDVTENFWRFVDKLNEGTDYPSAHVNLSDRRLGFRLKAPYAHVFALNHWGSEETAKQPVLDYEDLLFTGMAATDFILRVRILTPFAGWGGYYKPFVIACPKKIAHYVTPGTVVDCQEGALVYYGSAEFPGKSGNLERDDSGELLAIAMFGLAHNGMQRSAVALEIQEKSLAHPAGSMITANVGPGYWMPIGTVVTQRTIDFTSNKTNVSTEHVELSLSDWM